MAAGSPRRHTRILIVLGVVALVLVAGGLALEESSSSKPGPSLSVTSVLLDRVDAPSGSSFYIVQLNVSNPGPISWRFDPRFLELTSNSTHVYHPEPSYNETLLLGNSTIAKGNAVTGRVAFLLPVGESPSSLAYVDPDSGVGVHGVAAPPVSGVASRLGYNVRLVVNGIPVNGWTASQCPTGGANGTGTWVCSLILNGVVENSTLVFFTGQTAKVNLWFEYLKKPADPPTVTFESLAVGDGFQVLSYERAPSFAMTGWGGQGGVVLLLKIPPGEHSGPLVVTLSFSA